MNFASLIALNRNYGLVIGLLSALGARLVAITANPLWLDEVFTAELIKFDLNELIFRTALDVHPPLYYIALKGWASVFGHSDLALRGFSVFCGVATIYVVYKLVLRALDSQKIATIFLWIAALSPFLIEYSQQARMYTFASLLVTISTYAMWELVDRNPNSTKYKVIYVVATLAALMSHVFVVFAVAAQVIYIFFNRSSHTKNDSNQWTIMYVYIMTGFMIWLPVVLVRSALIEKYGFWISELTIERIADTASQLFSNRSIFDTVGTKSAQFFLIVGSTVLTLTSWASVVKPNKKELKFNRFIITIWLAPILLLIIASLPPLQSVYLYRYLYFTSPLLLISLAVGISKIDRVTKIPYSQLIVLVLLVITTSLGLHHVYGSGVVNNAHQAVEVYNSTINKPSTIIVSDDEQYLTIKHYLGNKVRLFIIKSDNDANKSPLLSLRDGIFIERQDPVLNNQSSWIISPEGLIDVR